MQLNCQLTHKLAKLSTTLQGTVLKVTHCSQTLYYSTPFNREESAQPRPDPHTLMVRCRVFFQFSPGFSRAPIVQRKQEKKPLSSLRKETSSRNQTSNRDVLLRWLKWNLSSSAINISALRTLDSRVRKKISLKRRSIRMYLSGIRRRSVSYSCSARSSHVRQFILRVITQRLTGAPPDTTRRRARPVWESAPSLSHGHL